MSELKYWDDERLMPMYYESRVQVVTEPKNILVVGDAGVGKTQYINKKLGYKFDPVYKPTEGGIKSRGNDTVTYHEWPGQEKHGDVKGVDTLPTIDKVIYLYDCTSKLSRKNIEDWEFAVCVCVCHNIPSEIIGNKFDKISETKVITRKMFSSK